MKVSYGKKTLSFKTKGGAMLNRIIANPGYVMFDDMGLRCTFSQASLLAGISTDYLKGIIEGARGARGFDQRVLDQFEAIRNLVADSDDCALKSDIKRVLAKGRV